MQDLAPDERGQHRLPLVAGHGIGDLAGERGVALTESVRNVGQGMPELFLDLRRAARVLHVLRREVAHEAACMRVDDEHRLEHGGRAARRARGELVQFRDDAVLRGQWIVGRKRHDPTLGGSDIAEGS